MQPYTEAIGFCKLPPFWKHCSQLWFIQVENQLLNHKITANSTKYSHLVAALDSDTMLEVSDILRAPPEKDKYDSLKQAIISRFTDSADPQLHEALTELQLGNLKPTQLLRQMKSLAGDRASEDVLRVRWLALFPPSIQRCLKILRGSTLDELAGVADELLENQPGPFVMTTNTPTSQTPLPHHRSTDGLLGTVITEIAAIKLSLAEVSTVMREPSKTMRSQPSTAMHSHRSRS